jgi:hypothetical protein
MIFDPLVDYYSINNFLIYFFSEIPNLIFCCLVVLFFLFLKLLTTREMAFWVFLFFLAFLINIFLQFLPSLFPDIGGYLRCIKDLKDNLFFDELSCQTNIGSASDDSLSFVSLKKGLPAIIYSLIPMPSIATFSSVGMINKLFLLFSYIYLRTKIHSKENLMLLALIFLLPSMLLYSSIGLRDNLVFVIQIFLLYFVLSNKFLLSTIFLSALFAIKTQNGIVFSFLYFGVFIFRANKGFKNLIIFSFVSLSAVYLLSDQVLATLNFFKIAFLVETQEVSLVRTFIPFESITSVLIYSPIEFFQGILRPFPNSIRSYVFFIESLIQIALILFLIISNKKKIIASPEFYLVFISFAIGIVLNSLIIENEFTYARYKYTFIYTFIIYLISINKSKFLIFANGRNER